MNQFIKNFQINLPLKPVITKKQPKNSSMSINSLLTKNQNPISAPKKINTDLIASTLNRKTSAKSEKVSINCDESIETKSTSSNIKKNKKVNKGIKVSKSLGSFNLFENDNIQEDENNDLQKMNINEIDRKKMLEYVKELKMRRELSVEGDFGTQCDSKYYYNDPVTDNIEEHERIQSELFRKAVEEFRNRNKDPKDIKEEMPQVDKSVKSITTNISENNNNNIVINPKNFLLEIGGSDLLNLNNLSLFANNGNDMDEDIENDPNLISTQACWNCFKIMDIDKGIAYEDRLFCSNKCVEKYKKKSDMKCSYCHKNFLKFNGVISGEKIFCSVKCLKDEKNSIKEIEGGEDNDEDEEGGNDNKDINNNNKENMEDEPVFSNEIDILDI